MKSTNSNATKISVKEIIASIGGQYSVLGNGDGFVRSACPIDKAVEDSLCFCKVKDEKALKMIESSKARVIICSNGLQFPTGKIPDKTLVQVANPRLAYARLLRKYFFHRPEPVIHPTAVIDVKAVRGSKVNIGPHSYVGNCQIGDGTFIEGNVYIDNGAKIGKRVIIHPGVVIGTEAVGFERNDEGELEWFPQLSGVVIEDEVEIGANSVVCRGSLNDTFIGRGTKIDNLVRIGHGVRIGKQCLIVAGTVICGSTRIGDNTWIGPVACIREGLSIGNRVVVGAGSVVHKDIPDDTIVTGSPARPISSLWFQKTI